MTGFLTAGTQWRQSQIRHGRQSRTWEKLSTLDFVMLLSLFRRKSTVTTSLNMCRTTIFIPSDAVLTLSKAGDFCRLNVERPFDMVDFVVSRPCCQCVPALTGHQHIKGEERET